MNPARRGAAVLTVLILAAVPVGTAAFAATPPAPAAPNAGTHLAVGQPTPAASPSGQGDPDGGKKCMTEIPGAPDLPAVPNLPNLPGCIKQRVEKGAGDLKDGITDAAADAVLTPLAEAIASTTNQLVLVTLTGWLQFPSIRLTESGVFVQPDQSRNDTTPPQGGCVQPIPNATLTPRPLNPGQPTSRTGTGVENTSCGTESKAVSQLASAKVHAVMISVGTVVAVLLLLFQAMRTAISRKGSHLIEALQGLLVTAVMGALGIVLLDGLLVFSDILTRQILHSAVGEGLGERVSAMLGLSVKALGPGPVILFGVFVFTIGLVQLVMLFVRQAAIPMLAMLMPIAAAGQIGGQISRQWLIRLWTSLFAIVLYKPLAALIFAVGFLEVGGGQGFWEIARGLTTLLLAILALPVLMKIFTPIVGQAVSIGSHHITLSGMTGGLGGGVSESGSMLSSLLGGRGGQSGDQADDQGGGQGDDSGPASPQSYEGAGTAAGAGPAAGLALAGAKMAGQATGAAARKADETIAQGTDAFTGGEGAGQQAPPSARPPGSGADDSSPLPVPPIASPDPRDDLRNLRPAPDPVPDGHRDPDGAPEDR